jgi:hypothetical protein
MISSKNYWTIAQAIVWVCTRDEAVVTAMPAPLSTETLCLQLKYRVGLKYTERKMLGGSTRHWVDLEINPRAPCKFSTGIEAIQFLQAGVLGGFIRTIARDARSGSWGAIPESERTELEFRIRPDDPLPRYGFCSTITGECRWIEPLLSIADVKRLAPLPTQSPTVAADKRMLDRLLEISVDRRPTREEALEKCRDVVGYSGRGFERAWKRLPDSRKRKRGEHGPRLLTESETSHRKPRTKLNPAAISK